MGRHDIRLGSCKPQRDFAPVNVPSYTAVWVMRNFTLFDVMAYCLAHLAIGIRSACASAWVNTVTAATSQMSRAFGVIQALSASTIAQRIATVAGRARAYWSAAKCLLTLCIHAAWAARTTLTCRCKQIQLISFVVRWEMSKSSSRTRIRGFWGKKRVVGGIACRVSI